METRYGASPVATAQAVTNKPLVFSKMEALVREMQDPENGVPIRSQKLFLTSIPSAFMGYDLVEWLMERLEIEETNEAIHLAQLLCQYGYFFPVGETRYLVVKDDSSLYRFQTPYYWPSQNHNADTTDYAIYLTKRLSRNKQKHGLEDYELESYNKLRKGLQHKWDFILMQSEEQVRVAKDRKKGDKIVTDSQERAYWRVYRPPPGFNNCLESAPVPDRNNMANRVKKKTVDSTKLEIELVNKQIERTRVKVSIATEGLLNYVDTYFEYDFFLVSPLPSNPWITEDVTFWVLNESLVDIATEKRVKRWGINFAELVNDPTGLNEFTNYLRKEYCHENIRFWQAVLDLRYGPAAEVSEKVNSIYAEFLKAGAPCEINIDGKTMEGTQQLMKTPTRYTYDLAAEHVYVLLLKKDCYPRFLRSDFYKNLQANAVQPSAKKRFFSFGGPGKKKAIAVPSTNSTTLQAQTPQPLKRHGSDENQGNILTMSAVGETLGPSSVLSALTPRVDCEPPYSAPERGAGENICPWDAPACDNVCPWEASTPIPVPKQPQQQTPPQSANQTLQQQATPQKLQTTLHHSLPPKSQLSKPKPDRSKSFDVNPAAPQRPQSATASSFAPSLDPIKGVSPTGEPVGIQKTPKSQSMEVVPWKGHPPTKKVPSMPPAGTKEGFQASLAPACSLLTERRASEGVLRMALGVCPLDEVFQMAQKGQSHESEIKINVLPSKEADEEGQEESTPLDHKVIDYSVQSGAQADPKQHPRTPPSPKAELELNVGAIERTVGDFLPSPTTSETKSTVPQRRHQNSPVSDPKVPTTEVKIPSTHSARKEESLSTSPKKTEEVTSKWEDSQSQKTTADVCPWEDDSLTPTWL